MNPKVKRLKRIRRHRRVRAKVFGTAQRPRLSVFRSAKHVHLQVIDDNSGKTLIAASTAELKDAKGKLGAAAAVGAMLAKLAQKSGIKAMVFDRGSRRYHGRVRAVAEALREKGIKV